MFRSTGITQGVHNDWGAQSFAVNLDVDTERANRAGVTNADVALALKQRGAEVGLVDLDVYGPDVPLMVGAKGRPGMFDTAARDFWRTIDVHVGRFVDAVAADEEPPVSGEDGLRALELTYAAIRSFEEGRAIQP